MRLFSFLRRRAGLLAELEALRSESRELREQRDTAVLRSWIHCPDPQMHRRKRAFHPVNPGRHRDDTPTEVHRRQR
ncbi:hypothetical protein GCM10010199_61670 [Dactylosporangium roseum]